MLEISRIASAQLATMISGTAGVTSLLSMGSQYVIWQQNRYGSAESRLKRRLLASAQISGGKRRHASVSSAPCTAVSAIRARSCCGNSGVRNGSKPIVSMQA